MDKTIKLIGNAHLDPIWLWRWQEGCGEVLQTFRSALDRLNEYDDLICRHDIKIIEGQERLFVAMPSRRDESGTFRDIIHPISAIARENIEKSILSAYNEYLSSLPLEQ